MENASYNNWKEAVKSLHSEVTYHNSHIEHYESNVVESDEDIIMQMMDISYIAENEQDEIVGYWSEASQNGIVLTTPIKYENISAFEVLSEYPNNMTMISY